MTETTISLLELHASYVIWVDPPVDVLELRHNATEAALPTALDVLFFQPTEEDELPEEEYFNFIATAGMSTYLMPGSQDPVELFLQVRGRHNFADLHSLGRRLAELAVLPFRENFAFVPGLVLHNVSLPLFTAMDSVLITHWAVHAPTWLPNTNPPVLLLSVIPLYESEAIIIAEIGEREAVLRFYAEEINWRDPHRSAAALRPRTTVDSPLQRRSVMPVEDVPAKVRAAWQGIEQWYAANTPRLEQDLQEGATAAQVTAFEQHTYLTLPADYKASLEIHDGEVSVYGYTYLSLDSVLNSWSNMTKLAEADTFAHAEVYEQGEGIIQNTWWHRGWIPFAEDSGGNMLCIDTTPAAKGVVGQVLRMEIGSGPGITEYASFLAWLEGYRDDLDAGKYQVDDEGFLFEV